MDLPSAALEPASTARRTTKRKELRLFETTRTRQEEDGFAGPMLLPMDASASCMNHPPGISGRPLSATFLDKDAAINIVGFGFDVYNRARRLQRLFWCHVLKDQLE
jgi:hypothetical protein